MRPSHNGIHCLRNLSKSDAGTLRMETSRRVATHLAHGALLDFERVCRGSLDIRMRPVKVNIALCGLANFICTAVEAATEEAQCLLRKYGGVSHDGSYLMQQIQGYTNTVRNHHANHDAYGKVMTDLRLFSRSTLFYFNLQAPGPPHELDMELLREGTDEGESSGAEEPIVPNISAPQRSLEHTVANATHLNKGTVIFNLGSDIMSSLENLYQALEIQSPNVERPGTEQSVEEQPDIITARTELRSFIQDLLKVRDMPENLQETTFDSLPPSPPLSPGSGISDVIVQVISSAVPDPQSVSTAKKPNLCVQHKDFLGHYFRSEVNTLDLMHKIQTHINSKVQHSTLETYLLRGVQDALREHSNSANMITFTSKSHSALDLKDQKTIESCQRAIEAPSNDDPPSAATSAAEQEASTQSPLEVRSMLDMRPEMREHFMRRACGLMQVLGSRELSDEEFEGLWQLWTRHWHKTSCDKVSSANTTINEARFTAPGVEKLLDMRARPEQRYRFKDYLSRMMQVLGSKDLNDEEFEALWNIWSRHYKA